MSGNFNLEIPFFFRTKLNFSIDCFTRKLYLRSVKSKTGTETANHLRSIFHEAGSAPNKLNSDLGGEFRNAQVSELMKQFRIEHFFSTSYQKGKPIFVIFMITLQPFDFKAQYAERAIATIRKLLTRLCAVSNTKNWPSLVSEVGKRLNNRLHSSIGMTPNEVNLDNTAAIFAKLHPELAKNQQPKAGLKPTFKIGDIVRIQYPKKNFEKGDISRNSDDIYMIARVLFHPIVRYKLADIPSREIVTGSFNEQELIPA